MKRQRRRRKNSADARMSYFLILLFRSALSPNVTVSVNMYKKPIHFKVHEQTLKCTHKHFPEHTCQMTHSADHTAPHV